MTGWRLGWLLVPERLRRAVDRLTGNFTICPPALAQHAAVAAFTPEGYAEADGHVARYAANRALLLDGLRRLGIDRLAPADGAFYVYADVAAPHRRLDGLDLPAARRDRRRARAGRRLRPGRRAPLGAVLVRGRGRRRPRGAGPAGEAGCPRALACGDGGRAAHRRLERQGRLAAHRPRRGLPRPLRLAGARHRRSARGARALDLVLTGHLGAVRRSTTWCGITLARQPPSLRRLPPARPGVPAAADVPPAARAPRHHRHQRAEPPAPRRRPRPHRDLHRRHRRAGRVRRGARRARGRAQRSRTPRSRPSARRCGGRSPRCPPSATATATRSPSRAGSSRRR